MTREELYEVLVLWGAYQDLHERLGGDPRTADPRDLIGKVAAFGRARAASAIFASACTTDLADAEHVLDELLELAARRRRPRYGAELGPDFLAELLGTTPSTASNSEGASS